MFVCVLEFFTASDGRGAGSFKARTGTSFQDTMVTSIAYKGANSLAEEKQVYKAVYQGSGTFVISKPKRKNAKIHQSRIKNPRRGSRKS